MSPFNLMEAFGALPEEFIAQELAYAPAAPANAALSAGGAGAVPLPAGDLPERETAVSADDPPQRISMHMIRSAAVAAAAFVLIAGFAVFLHSLGDAPEHLASHPDPDNSAVTELTVTETTAAQTTETTVTTAKTTVSGSRTTTVSGTAEQTADITSETDSTRTENPQDSRAAQENSTASDAASGTTGTTGTTPTTTASTRATEPQPYDCTVDLHFDSWETPQYVGEELDLNLLFLSVTGTNPRQKWSQTVYEDFRASFSGKNEFTKGCWKLDTSEVNFDEPGTYTVWIEAVEGAVGQFTYYNTEFTFESVTVNGRMNAARIPVSVTLIPRSDEMKFVYTDEGYLDADGVFTFNPIFSGYLKLENVWSGEITVESSDPGHVKVGEVRTYDGGRTYGIMLYGGSEGDGYATITATAPDGRTASAEVRTVYVNDDLSDNPYTSD